MPHLIVFFILSGLDLALRNLCNDDETFVTTMLMDKSDEFIGKEGVETEVKLKLETKKRFQKRNNCLYLEAILPVTRVTRWILNGFKGEVPSRYSREEKLKVASFQRCHSKTQVIPLLESIQRDFSVIEGPLMNKIERYLEKERYKNRKLT